MNVHGRVSRQTGADRRTVSLVQTSATFSRSKELLSISIYCNWENSLRHQQQLRSTVDSEGYWQQHQSERFSSDTSVFWIFSETRSFDKPKNTFNLETSSCIAKATEAASRHLWRAQNLRWDEMLKRYGLHRYSLDAGFSTRIGLYAWKVQTGKPVLFAWRRRRRLYRLVAVPLQAIKLQIHGRQFFFFSVISQNDTHRDNDGISESVLSSFLSISGNSEVVHVLLHTFLTNIFDFHEDTILM